MRLAAFALLLSLLACRGKEPAPPPRHLVLVTIDTLRADRLSCYGNRDVATPHLDRIATEGALARDASVHAPLTRPSHVSILTGLYPAEHGIRDNVSPPLSEKIPTLAQVLQSAGYRTAAFVSSIVLSSQSGLSRGFETYADSFEISENDARFLNTIQRRGDGPTQEAIEWITANRGERFFLWLHLYDPHDPYEPPEPYASRYRGREYDGEVAWSDELMGRLDDALSKLGLKETTLLVVTSDHGEGLGEHGETHHGFFLYESTLRVPLLLRGPGVRPGLRLEGTARSVDLLPTALDFLGVVAPAGQAFSGRSLAGALRGEELLPAVPTYAETLVPLLHFGWSDLHAAREREWKFILAPRPELYNVQKDAEELENRIVFDSARAKVLRADLERRLADESEAPADSSPAVPPDLLEKLGALGYVSATAALKTTGPRADPKDKIEDYKEVSRLLREGMTALREKRYGESAARFRTLLARETESLEVHYYLGRALIGLGEDREAAAQFAKTLERDPWFTPAYLELANVRFALKDVKGAVASLRDGQKRAPADPRFFDREGEMWQKIGRPGEAIRAYQAALALAPKDALVRVRLGELYRDQGEIERAKSLLSEAVKLNPNSASYWNSLGMLLGGGGDLKGGEEAFRSAFRLDGTNAQYAYNLGLAVLRQGRPAEAGPYFRKTLELEPRFQAARDRLSEIRTHEERKARERSEESARGPVNTQKVRSGTLPRS